MYIQLAPGKVKAGVDEQTLLKASDEFDANFVQKQKGIIKRILMKGKDGTYADLVFFESKEAADRVAEVEQAGHPACMAFFQLFEMDETKPDMGVLSFEGMKTYGKQV
jgi:hypothetical protein